MIQNLFQLFELIQTTVDNTKSKMFKLLMKVLIEDPVAKAITEMSPSKLSIRDVYFRLFACLDREIELVWKRAVFLTAFLIACFAGYGGLIATYLGIDKPRQGTFAVISIAAIGIAFIGMALSVIWIMMAKGSKAWQEHYEKVIECFVAKYVKDDTQLRVFASGDYKSLPQICYALVNEGEDRMIVPKTDERIFTLAGGHSSVSKIAIGIGQGALRLWGGIAIVHIMYLAGHFRHCVTSFSRFAGNWVGPIIVLIVIAVLLVKWRSLFHALIRWAFIVPFKSGYFDALKQRLSVSSAEGGR